MPADLRAHARYPETLFRVQAEIYRTYHMLDPQAFYNKEDLWDLARYGPAAGADTAAGEPDLRGGHPARTDKPEFLLMTPFTPRNKDNLIGLMLARCDGEQSRRDRRAAALQAGADLRADADRRAHQPGPEHFQGPDALEPAGLAGAARARSLVLPVGDTFLYVEPIYIQATEARMPQLKKVVLRNGNRLIYADTYDQAIAQLGTGAPPPATQVAAIPPPPAASPPAVVPSDRKLESVRNHLRRYRDLMGRGQWAEAGKELESIESELK